MLKHYIKTCSIHLRREYMQYIIQVVASGSTVMKSNSVFSLYQDDISGKVLFIYQIFIEHT